MGIGSHGTYRRSPDAVLRRLPGGTNPGGPGNQPGGNPPGVPFTVPSQNHSVAVTNDLTGRRLFLTWEVDGDVTRHPVDGQPMGRLLGLAVIDTRTGYVVHAYLALSGGVSFRRFRCTRRPEAQPGTTRQFVVARPTWIAPRRFRAAADGMCNCQTHAFRGRPMGGPALQA